MIERVTSTRFPYLPLNVSVRDHRFQVEALLDTGFDGDVVLPLSLALAGESPDYLTPYTLADASGSFPQTDLGEVRLGSAVIVPAHIILLGDEALVGRGISDRFTIILDHGRQVIVEP
jgi:hypothetical protein